jgi:hypothetical protein
MTGAKEQERNKSDSRFMEWAARWGKEHEGKQVGGYQGDLVRYLVLPGVGDYEVVSCHQQDALLPFSLTELENFFTFQSLGLRRQLPKGQLIPDFFLSLIQACKYRHDLHFRHCTSN